jgi:hypothetical protein
MITAHRYLTFAGLLPGLLVLASCSFPPVKQTGIETAWVVLGDNGVAIARVVTSAAECPALIQDGVAREMTVRARPATIGQRATASDPADSKAAEFPVLTCEVPVWGNQPGIEAQPGNAALQAVMERVDGKRLFPRSVGISLAGHVHLFEAIGFASDHPAQLVIGNGGTSLDPALPRTLSPTTTPFPDAVVDSFSSTATFAFVTIERIDKRWSMRSWDRQGKLMKRCGFDGGKLSCNP